MKPTPRPRRHTPRKHQTTQAEPPAAQPAAPPPVPQPPTKRPLHGWVAVPDTTGTLRGTLQYFRAEYDPQFEAVSVHLELHDGFSLGVRPDHAQTRAAIAKLEDALHTCERFHRRSGIEALLTHAATVSCRAFTTPCDGDEELRFYYLPRLEMIQMRAWFRTHGRNFTLYALLTRTESEALLHDFRRALDDFENYGDTGL